MISGRAVAWAARSASRSHLAAISGSGSPHRFSSLFLTLVTTATTNNTTTTTTTTTTTATTTLFYPSSTTILVVYSFSSTPSKKFTLLKNKMGLRLWSKLVVVDDNVAAIIPSIVTQKRAATTEGALGK
ncbi:hypothetical protein M0802_006182 [Mischocyttarus mexicanus]|nr:hypothetical protein M0802_006182 [Mischocyttarus mexicanus]